MSWSICELCTSDSRWFYWSPQVKRCDLSYNCRQWMLVTFRPCKCTMKSETPVFGQICLSSFLLSTGNWLWKFLAKYETRWRRTPPWETTATWIGLSMWSESSRLWQRSFSNTGNCTFLPVFITGREVARSFSSVEWKVSSSRPAFDWSELGSLGLLLRKSTIEGVSVCETCSCKDKSCVLSFDWCDFLNWSTSLNNLLKKSTTRFWTCDSASAPCGSFPKDNIFLSSWRDFPSASP